LLTRFGGLLAPIQLGKASNEFSPPESGL